MWDVGCVNGVFCCCNVVHPGLLSRIAMCRPELFPGLLAAMQGHGPDQPPVDCAMGCLHQALKELASKKINNNPQAYEQVWHVQSNFAAVCWHF
jgi:hypothetical protein